MIFPEDHDPPHVPVYAADGRAKNYLEPVSLEYQVGMKVIEVSQAIRLVTAHQAHLAQRWSEINGHP